MLQFSVIGQDCRFAPLSRVENPRIGGTQSLQDSLVFCRIQIRDLTRLLLDSRIAHDGQCRLPHQILLITGREEPSQAICLGDHMLCHNSFRRRLKHLPQVIESVGRHPIASPNTV